MVHAHEINYQVGCIVKIKKEPKMAKHNGFILGSFHVIENPPEHHINSPMSVWVKNKYGVLKCLHFTEFACTPKKGNVHIKRIRKK